MGSVTCAETVVGVDDRALAHLRIGIVRRVVAGRRVLPAGREDRRRVCAAH